MTKPKLRFSKRAAPDHIPRLVWLHACGGPTALQHRPRVFDRLMTQWEYERVRAVGVAQIPSGYQQMAEQLTLPQLTLTEPQFQWGPAPWLRLLSQQALEPDLTHRQGTEPARQAQQ